MKGWIYVLQLDPTGCIKVGRTDDVTRRLAEHMESASSYGVRITCVASFSTGDMVRAERALLDKLSRKAGRISQETFAGVSFGSVSALAQSVVSGFPAQAEPVAPTPPGDPKPAYRPVTRMDVYSEVKMIEETRDLLADVSDSLGAEAVVSSTAVAARLRALAPECPQYRTLDGARLVKLLAVKGVEVKQKNGVRVVRRERVYAALGGCEESEVS